MGTVSIPLLMAGRPRWRGLVVPYITGLDADGAPMFRTNHEGRRVECIAKRWCGMCGRPLGYVMVFVVGEVTPPFYCLEPAQHPACNRYVLAVCPYFANPRYEVRHRELRNLSPTTVALDVMREPEGPRLAGHQRIGLWHTTGYRYEPTPEGVVVAPGPARTLEWVDLS
jgi:hypothetical protein